MVLKPAEDQKFGLCPRLESIPHGRELFDKMQCWKCHGTEGREDGPSAQTLTVNAVSRNGTFTGSS
ncbi:MAG: hypothetical protein DMF15_05760 [Verrucomicrobia bacterium]|nr:MAG: hypothetical protein DMF15_05760 [Verrucomicrobiota bacterium]